MFAVAQCIEIVRTIQRPFRMKFLDIRGAASSSFATKSQVLSSNNNCFYCMLQHKCSCLPRVFTGLIGIPSCPVDVSADTLLYALFHPLGVICGTSLMYGWLPLQSILSVFFGIIYIYIQMNIYNIYKSSYIYSLTCPISS